MDQADTADWRAFAGARAVKSPHRTPINDHVTINP